MKVTYILIASLAPLWTSSFAYAQDKGFRIDPLYNNTCTNRESAGTYWQFGNNPGIWSECGLIEGGVAPANLQKANLRGLIARNVSFDDSNLTDADLSKSELEKIQGSRANFSRTNFSEANISDSIFNNSKFVGAIFDYTKLKKVDAGGGDFRSAVGKGFEWNIGNLIGSDWTDAKMMGGSFTWVTAARSKMVQASFKKTKLHSNFSSSDFTGADLSLSDLSETNLMYSKLKKTNLKDAFLLNASALASELPFTQERATELGMITY